MIAPEQARRHALEGVLRRLVASPHAGAFVLRGGMLSRAWLGPERRTTDDIDFLALYPFDVAATEERWRCVLEASIDDGVSFEMASLYALAIWEETEFPGARVGVQAEVGAAYFDLQIDVGFGDPLVPPAVLQEVPLLGGERLEVLACRPETLVGWKLHGLFEHGIRRWRAKDLHDLLLLLRHVALEMAVLPEAIRIAFESRHLPPADALPVLYDADWWRTEKAVERWRKFRAGAPRPVPDDLSAVVAEVGERLRPALARLLS